MAIPTVLEQRAAVTRRVTLVGAVVNLLLGVLKVVVGVAGHSQSLVADGIHSISDLLSDGLVMFAAHHSHQQPDERHPYGHGRFETVATLGLALILLLVAAGLVWDAAHRMFDPEQLLRPEPIVLYVAALSVLSKEWLYHYTRIAARRIRSEMMRANAWHHRSDAISSVVVMVGVAGTLAGLPYLDAVAAAIVGLMVAKIGWDLAWGSMNELVDTGLEASRIHAIRDTILSVGGVRDIHMLRTRSLGGIAAADVHVLVEPKLSVSEGHMISLMVEQKLKEQIQEIEDVTVHIDPEDDEVSLPCIGLPLRSEVLRQLDSAWVDFPQTSRRTRIALHYLNGKIDVDLYLSLDQYDNPEARKGFASALQKAVDPLGDYGRIRVYFE